MTMGIDDMSVDLDDKLGSFDEGDPQTTNLYVGNLSPQVILHDDTHFSE
jgi:U2-associated protein SR140